MKNVKLIIAYFGRSFSGWQKTNTGTSIEEALEKALQQILQHEVQLQAASRTDAGVHAEGQVVNFFTPKAVCLKTLLHGLNGLLPKDISVLSAEEMPIDFHPTLSCQKKEYWYSFCHSEVQMPFFRHVSWHFAYALDRNKMQEAASHLIGVHDFSSFCNERALWDRSPVCNIEKIEWDFPEDGRLCMVVTGDHFLYRMVRNIAGTLAYAGCGKLDPEQIPAILAGKDRTQSGMTAPAHGLTLKRVFYTAPA